MKEKKLSGPINQSVNQTNNLVFLLHGWGSNGNDLIQLSYHWKSNLDSITFIAPNGLKFVKEILLVDNGSIYLLKILQK